MSHPVYAPDDYTAPQALGSAVKDEGVPGLRYYSVRKPGALCWAHILRKRVHDAISQPRARGCLIQPGNLAPSPLVPDDGATIL
ncbi:RES family NAD+ phosphorylase [Halomonas mongoliensis]|uniref:RES family NAD+ phosphorylase n=1 Tax=Halomonas mongoliensis TaxID=321265 RepID=UPI00403B2E7F